MSAQAGTGELAAQARVGVDIGGTFTDIVLWPPAGPPVCLKVLSSPPEFARAVVSGLEQAIQIAGLRADEVSGVRHGTTVATNAILERRGAPVALITTRGFRDVLEIGRMRRPNLYDVDWDRPEALVPRFARLELDERVAAGGDVLKPVDGEDLRHVLGELRRLEVQSVAISMINSYANGEHELEAGQAVRAEMPELHVTLSHELVSEIGEYERTSTAVVNAYLQPVVWAYVQDLASRLEELGIHGDLLIMQSNGGLTDGVAAREQPFRIIESGPAAGVAAAQSWAKRCGYEDVIAFDMGGTTAKASLIEGGRALEVQECDVGGGMNASRLLSKGSGFAVRVPSLDIAEVGAGGGSLCWIDSGGVPRVGPESAGALPGPACYGLGGIQPTLTDVQVVLGYLSPDSLAGGAQLIDRERALRAVEKLIAEPLGLGVLEAAHGLYTIGITNMSRAVRGVTTERGRDPRRFVLFAFGGAGPAYVVELARQFGIETVVVPPQSGLFSAVGLLLAPSRYDEVAAFADGGLASVDELNDAFAEVEARLFAKAPKAADMRVERSLDLRYAGQSSALRIGVPTAVLGQESVALISERFASEHERTFGHRRPVETVEVVNVRSRIVERQEHQPISVQKYDSNGGTTERDVYFGPQIGTVTTPVVQRGDIDASFTEGPVIVEDMDATTVVLQGSAVRRDGNNNLLIRVAT